MSLIQNTLNLGCIVEGHGDVKAVPVLVRRIQQELAPSVNLIIRQPFRLPRTKLDKPDKLKNALNSLAKYLPPPRAILILVDADKDCPATLGPELVKQAQKARSDIQIGIVLAKHEFESWFLAAASSIAGRRGLRPELPEISDPEAIRGAKEWLGKNMPPSTKYKETVDQASLAAVFDLELAQKHSPSFDKCRREIERLLKTAGSSPAL